MPKHSSYDPALRKTDHGSGLYTAWKRARKQPHCDEWDYFPTFYDWAMQNGYEVGAWLRRIDTNKPYEPENCIWYLSEVSDRNIPPEFADNWNKAVNRIRKHYGMPPLRGTKYGD
jgi:hypothetical protein